MKRILIVEDELAIRQMTKKYLMNVGYEVITAEDGPQALKLLEKITPDLILLDIEMPNMSGFSVCQEIRKRMTVPIIFLTVRRDTLDKVKCFEIGGDDFVTKPFDFEELEARIKANIRRYYTYQKNVSILKYGPLEINLHELEVWLDDEKINLSTKELELLIHLAKNPNQVWSQEQLYDHIWSIDGTGNIETVKVHISYLRKKLEKNKTNQKFIKTVHGFGYIFSID